MTTRSSDNLLLSTEIGEVEDQLQESFRPVIPDPEFVRRLQHRLVTAPSTILEPRYKVESLIIILSGILGVLFLFVAFKKIIDSLVSILPTDRDGG